MSYTTKYVYAKKFTNTQQETGALTKSKIFKADLMAIANMAIAIEHEVAYGHSISIFRFDLGLF